MREISICVYPPGVYVLGYYNVMLAYVCTACSLRMAQTVPLHHHSNTRVVADRDSDSRSNDAFTGRIRTPFVCD